MDALALMLAAVAGLVVGAALGGWLVGRGSAQRAAVLREDFETLRGAVATEREARATAETAAALARQEAEHARLAVADWEKTRDEFLKSTQASVLATAQQISSKLLEDHKRETAEAKADAERQIKQTTETLRTEVQQVTDGMAQLKGQVADKAKALDIVWRALSSPGGAGYFAEIGLANTLKSFGLMQERDFLLQATVQDEHSRKRPDAIVFLPGDAVLVIDSKATKYLIDLPRRRHGTRGGRLSRPRPHDEPASEGSGGSRLPLRGRGEHAQGGQGRRHRPLHDGDVPAERGGAGKARPGRSVLHAEGGAGTDHPRWDRPGSPASSASRLSRSA